MIDKEKVIEALRECYDPEIPINVVDLGLVYNIAIEDESIKITMTLTSPFCPIIDYFIEDVKHKVMEKTGAKNVDIDITFDPPWSLDKMSEKAKEQLGLV
jgi:metal-sulfur cluster biosynthetic enzyme